jgi:hypothetical protein
MVTASSELTPEIIAFRTAQVEAFEGTTKLAPQTLQMVRDKILTAPLTAAERQRFLTDVNNTGSGTPLTGQVQDNAGQGFTAEQLAQLQTDAQGNTFFPGGGPQPTNPQQPTAPTLTDLGINENTPLGSLTPEQLNAMRPPGTTQTGTTQTNTQQGVQNPIDLLNEFLESDPDLALNLAANELRSRGASNVFMQWFVGNFQSFWGRYLGELAFQASQGQVPTMSFVDFVGSMDPNREFFGTGAPRARSVGAQSSRFAQFVTQQGQQ